MAQFQNWLSAERPNSLQSSPSVTAAAEIRGRLNFSSVKTPPTAVRKLPYSELSTMPNIGNRLGDYHMSKQNPAVIDQLYSPSPSSSPYKNNLYKTASPLLNDSRHLNRNRTQVQTFLQQTLNRRNSLPGGTGTSLVHLAIQGRQRKCGSVPVSPVIVRLSGYNVEDSKGVGLESLEEEETAVNPCDKDVVISALRQKRKRWPTSYDNKSPVSDILPSAKRSRHSTHPQDGPTSPSNMPYGKQLPERKRMIAAQANSQVLKKAKMAHSSLALNTLSTSSTHKENLLNRLRVPDIEYESDNETTSTGEGSGCDVGPERRNLENRDTESVSTGRSNTPVLQEEEEDAAIKRKREESLKLQKSLTAVFPSSLSRKSSTRRKLPVFCATGSKPHLPMPLSLSHSATPEDLKKDREAAAAKLKDFLSDEDEEDKKKELEGKVGAQVPVSTSQPPLTVVTATSATTAVLPTLTASAGLPTPPTSATSLIPIPGTLQIEKDNQAPFISTAAGQESVSSSLTSTSLQKPLTNSSSLTSLPTITTSASRAAAILSSSQTGLTSRLSGLSSTGSLPSLQFKAPERTSSAPKSVSFLLPTSTSSPPLTAAPGQGSLMAGALMQPGPVTTQLQPAGGLQFSSAGGGGLVAPVLSVSTTSGSIMATKSTAANSLPTFNFSAPLQSAAPNSTTASSATVQQGPGLMLTGGPQLATQNVFQSVTQSAGTGEGLFPKATASSAAPMFSLSSLTQQSAGNMFSQNKPTLVTSQANTFQGLQMATSSGGSMFSTVPTTSSATSAKFSFNLANNPFNPSTSTTQGTKGLNVTSNQPQQGSIFGQNMATGGSNSDTRGLLQNVTASNLSSGGLNFNLSAGNSQTGTFNFSAGSTRAKPTLGGLQMPQTQQSQQAMTSLIGGARAGNQSGQAGFNFSAGMKLGSLGGQPQNTTNTGNIFGGSLASNSAPTPFNFSANQQGSAQPTLGGLFSGGVKGSQRTTPAQPSTLNFTGGLNLQSQQPSVFNTGPKQQQPFNFSAGMNSGQGQQQTQGFNFSVSGQGQNLNQTSGFNFSAGGLGQQIQNASTGMFGNNSQQSNVFGTGNGNQTLNQGTSIGGGFQTSQQTGFDFGRLQHSTPNFNFSAGTPQGGLGASPAFNFSAGTPGTTPGRSVAKPRRRIKK